MLAFRVVQLWHSFPMPSLVPNVMAHHLDRTDRLERLNVLGRNVAEVAEIWSSLEDLQHICLVHHLHPCGVDQRTALGHLGQQILRDS